MSNATRDPVFQNACELARSIRKGEQSATEVVEAHLAHIAALNPALNAIVTLDETNARQRAREADEALAAGELWGPLHGVPMTCKDAFETAGLRTTAGHPPLLEHVPGEDATVVARLRGAGAILLGKTNLPALAMDLQTDNALFGATKNPWSATHTPGGSSGGEAAALAAGLTPLGLGSDIGGSVRIPAHYSGVCSLKPTQGRVPNTGHIPPLPGTLNALRHLMVCGPMARSVEDLRLALSVLAGPDGRDASAVPVPLGPATKRPPGGLRIAWTDDFGGLPVTGETRAALAELAADLGDAGCQVERAAPTEFDFDEAWQTYGALFGIMASTMLGLLPRVAIRSLGRLVVKDVISRAGARRALASPRDYFTILERKDRLARAMDRFLQPYDAWLCPVACTPAFPLRKTGRIHTPMDVDGVSVPGNLAGTGYTCLFNLTGNPVVVLPLTTTAEGLPLGVQVVGRTWSDMALLDTAQALTRITGPFRRPPGY